MASVNLDALAGRIELANGDDIRIGADILTRAALAEEFAAASGQYFDNDTGQFAAPHPDALDSR
ncbi:hypothetical protein [Pseudomaricurvus alcaniphilus]|uniref:hypothetical protein n=1 Tax=Pseudomaricurvus alcaniphilus TaxID=1166482 RepID=UPI001A9E8F87|nr:hypothetical protein [Pseudomaricurvus alcaniphilus]